LAERPKPTAKALAIRWLARRDLSRAELAQRLRRRGVEQDEVERALADLTALGYLSDARYATAVVAQRKGRYGKRAIVHALRERGIAAQDADTALAQLAGSDEGDDALALWQRRFGVPPRDERDKARQVRFLQSRGYPLSVALSVLRRVGVRDADESF
jgi:regulatory protein